MLNLKQYVRARRYWRTVLTQQNENARAVNRSALLAAARIVRPGIDRLLTDLHRDGVVTIESYWSEAQCIQARDELDQLMQGHPECVRHFSNGSDRRVFGAEMAGSAVRQFHEDAFLKSIGEIKGGFELYNLATLGARIDAVKENRGSGDGWHRDTFGFQFKAILYLCDVTDDNGPFEYVPGSHKQWRAGIDTALGRFPAPPESRIDRDRMESLIARGAVRPKRFKAKAGTVILANTTGVHTGAPLLSGSRFALTNYYYYPYQIGKNLVAKFEPLVPGVAERLAPFLRAEEQMTSTIGLKHAE